MGKKLFSSFYRAWGTSMYYVIKNGEGGVSQMLKRLLLKRGGGGLRGHAYAIIFWKKLLHYFHAYLFWFVWYLIFLKLCTPQLCIIRHKPSSVRAFPLSKPRIANFRLGKSARQDFLHNGPFFVCKIIGTSKPQMCSFTLQISQHLTDAATRHTKAHYVVLIFRWQFSVYASTCPEIKSNFLE